MKLFQSQFFRPASSIFRAGALFATISVSNIAVAQAPAIKPSSTKIDDPLLKAMQTELDREKAQLLLPGMTRPYFIEYRLEDFKTYEAVAGYGALTREEQANQRFVRVTVRIGDYASDSSSARGDGSIQLAPQDNNPIALRYALWTATDDAYKNALRSYAAKQAALKQFQTPPNHEDFAKATPVVHIEPLVSLDSTARVEAPPHRGQRPLCHRS